MVKFFGTPNLVVNHFSIDRLGRKSRTPVFLFRFDEKGEAVVDETKLNPLTLRKLSQQFRYQKDYIEEERPTMEELIEEAKSLGIRSPHLMKKETLMKKILEKVEK